MQTRTTALVAALALQACMPDFNDETKALLKKTELLSVVLEPPEAGPGEEMTASFLLADEKGPVAPTWCHWLPIDPLASDPARLGLELAALAIAPADLTRPRLTLTTKSAADYHFDGGGHAAQPVWLAVQTKPWAVPVSLEDVDDLASRGVVEVAQRTLLVSTRQSGLANPTVAEIKGGPDLVPVALVRHDDPDLSASRARAAANPLEVVEREEIELRVRIGSGEPEDQLRYQWISTGGDFGGTRKREQKWVAPELRPTQTDRPDPREDPNLYPIWLVVRNSLGDARVGQSWVELYLRIRRKE